MRFLFKRILSLLFTLTIGYLSAKTQTSRDSLNQNVQQLQSTTGDAYFTLLEKIIDISTRVKPLPAIPEGAREKYVMALSLREDANKEEDFDRPLSLLREARTLAPWWPDAHKELGITFEMNGAYNEKAYDNAIYNFNNFLLTKPSDEEARKVQDEIYIAKAKKEKAIQKLNEEKVNAENEKLKSLVGKWGPQISTYWDYLIIEKLASGSYKITWIYKDNDPRNYADLGTGNDVRIDVIKAGGFSRTSFELSEDGNKCLVNFKFDDGNVNRQELTEVIRR